MIQPSTRLSAHARREVTVAAAAQVFAQRGYGAATTDQVARAAGISQPYVVRMFGTKEALFVAVIDRSLRLLLDAFRAALSGQASQSAPVLAPRPGLPSAQMIRVDADDADSPENPKGTNASLMTLHMLGRTYVDLARSEQVHLPLMHAYAASTDPVIGSAAREGFTQILDFLLLEAGLSPQEAERFLAQGMLINTLLALGAHDNTVLKHAARDAPALRRLIEQVGLTTTQE